MLSLIIPTRNRDLELRETVRRIGALPMTVFGDDAELIIVDNASDSCVEAPLMLANGVQVRVHRSSINLGAAGRNLGAEHARGEWIIMLDDDSSPSLHQPGGSLAGVLGHLPSDVAAIGGEIRLAASQREAGGLPEVVIGCGCAIRKDTFLSVGGYDLAFEYYVEEYDLCARLIQSGARVAHSGALAFEHRKTSAGRDFSRIIFRLVRNNAWTIARYAPRSVRDAALAECFARYERIAQREEVTDAYDLAVDEATRTLGSQPDREMTKEHWDRFTGAHAVRSGALETLSAMGVRAVRLVEPGKGEDVIRSELASAGISVEQAADTTLVGTLSPGPMLDAFERSDGQALCPYTVTSGRPASAAAA